MMILVVDDDTRIRTSTASLLENEGYKVIACASGEAALAALENSSDISFLLSDVLMPGMKGTELVTRATAQRPELGVLFMSGDVGDTPTKDFAGHEILSKPFTATALLAAIARANELHL